jgi:hypothetical protein
MAMALAPAEPIGTSSAPSFCSNLERLRCRAGAGHNHPQLRGGWRDCTWLIGAQDKSTVQPRQSDRADRRHAIDREGDMDGPVSPRLTIFARAIDRIDDPDPALGQALLGVLGLFGQQGIVGPRLANGMAEELVCGLIARLAQRLGAEDARGADIQQQLARCLRQMGRQFGVGHDRPMLAAHGMSLATMASAASSAVMALVSMRISGPPVLIGAVDAGEVLKSYRCAPFCRGP